MKGSEWSFLNPRRNKNCNLMLAREGEESSLKNAARKIDLSILNDHKSSQLSISFAGTEDAKNLHESFVIELL